MKHETKRNGKGKIYVSECLSSDAIFRESAILCSDFGAKEGMSKCKLAQQVGAVLFDKLQYVGNYVTNV